MSTKTTAPFTPAELDMIRFALNQIIEALDGVKGMEATSDRRAYKKLGKKVGGL